MAVFNAIKRAQDGTFKGGTDVIHTVENDGVGLGKIGPAGQKYADQVEEIKTRSPPARSRTSPTRCPSSE